jgi:hypothetical protein
MLVTEADFGFSERTRKGRKTNTAGGRHGRGRQVEGRDPLLAKTKQNLKISDRDTLY